MSNSSTENTVSTATRISNIEPTEDFLTGRAGLSLFVRYLRAIDLAPHLSRLFGSMRKSAKGQPVVEVFKQVFCFFIDGTSRHLTYFDALKEDAAYGATIETQAQALQSSHAVKRFFKAFSWFRIWLFRRLLQSLFLWRLKLAKPPVVVLGIDTMVMDNDEAGKRHGVAPTYKPVKGFQPLQVSWSRFLIDAVFRGGDKHSNYSDTVEKMVRHLVAKIRRHYEPEAPIIIRLDSGFFDQKLMAVFEELKIGYIVAGKLYADIKTKVGQFDPSPWKTLDNGRDQSEYAE